MASGIRSYGSMVLGAPGLMLIVQNIKQQYKSNTQLTDGEPFPFERLRLKNTSQRQLLAKYPIFFRAARYPEHYPSNIGYWGVECGPGWYPLLDRTAYEIELELEKLAGPGNSAKNIAWCDQKLREIRADWQSSGLKMDLPGPLIPYCHTIEVSSGCLHVSLCGGELCATATWKNLLVILANAENVSATICECCGERGVYRPGYWERVLCDSCENGQFLTGGCVASLGDFQ